MQKQVKQWLEDAKTPKTTQDLLAWIKQGASLYQWFSVDVKNPKFTERTTYEQYGYRFHGDECSKTTPGYYCGNWIPTMYADEISRLVIEQGWKITQVSIG